MADKKLTVYFTSDLHGYIYPTDYRSRDERAISGLTHVVINT